jgi:hypothetical protein
MLICHVLSFIYIFLFSFDFVAQQTFKALRRAVYGINSIILSHPSTNSKFVVIPIKTNVPRFYRFMIIVRTGLSHFHSNVDLFIFFFSPFLYYSLLGGFRFS